MSAPDVSDEKRRLRPYNTGSTTGKTCLVGLVLSCILASFGLIVVVALATSLAKNKDLKLVNSTGVVPTGLDGQAVLFTIPLVLAIIRTFCNESLGLVHTTSQRWALWREDRLNFNTNLLLMTQAPSSKPNHWAINLCAILVTALAYTAAGQISIVNLQFTVASRLDLLNLSFSVPALAVMTFGLFSQTAIATWYFSAMRHHVPTWSANPLNNSLDCAHQGIKSRPNRTLVSYHKYRDRSDARFPSLVPQRRQLSRAASRPSAILVTVLLWAAVLGTLIWASCIFGFGQDMSQGARTRVLHRGKVLTWTSSWSSSAQFRWTVVLSGIAFTFATQLTFTVALHCPELLVNATNDERMWQKASDHLKARRY